MRVEHPTLHIVAVLPESSAELTTGRLIRQMAQRGGYFSWGRVPMHLLLPKAVCTVRADAGASGPNGARSHPCAIITPNQKLLATAGEKTRAKLSVLAEIYCTVDMLSIESRKGFGPMPRVRNQRPVQGL